jgi:hypothetical protein
MDKMSDPLCSTGPGSKDAAVSPLAGRLIVVVGAGGAGKAIAYGAKKKGARVVVANRTYGKVLYFCWTVFFSISIFIIFINRSIFMFILYWSSIIYYAHIIILKHW